MGLLSWWKGSKQTSSSSSGSNAAAQKPDSDPPPAPAPAPGMNGAVEVPRPGGPSLGVTVFEFGSVAASTDKVTLAGYCPVSDELEPCRWEILPASGDDAPQFRVVF